MRIQIGRIVNTDADVNLLDLSPIDRVIAAGLNAYHNTGLYKRRYAESEERKSEQKRKVREALVDNLLSMIYQQLEENALLKIKMTCVVEFLLKFLRGSLSCCRRS